MDNKIPLQIPSYLNKYSSMVSGGLKIEFITQENVDAELLSNIISLKDKLGWLFFGVKQIEAVDLIDLPKIDKTKYVDAKTPSQRLRAVLFLLWQKTAKENGVDKDKFYEDQMEKIINWVKEKLD